MFGLLGKKLGHSFSKTIHENFTNEEYKLIETNNLNQFFNDYSFKGLNVTIPYKQDVIKHLDELSPEASEINSVNTVIFENGKLIGYNTDDFGLSKMLNYYNIDVSNKTIIILGNGSTSRTIQHYCSKNHAKKVVVLARNPMENEYYFKDVVNFREASIIFNATPVGMFPNNNQSIPISLNELPNLDSVVDMIYNPLRSLFILEAEERNIKAVNGLLMLIFQAVKSIELFHNISISDDKVMKYYYKLYFQKANLVIIGMPMSGKSLYSKLISQQYGKQLIDIDQEISIYAEDTIENIFLIHGENHFRAIEKRIITLHSKSNNKAISCGGGVILNKENIVNLKQNGIIIFIDMPLDLLMQCNPRNRPLLQNKDNLPILYKDRIHLYRAFQDITITKTSFDKKAVMNQIEVKLNEYISS